MRLCLVVPPSPVLAAPRSNTPLGVLYVASYAEAQGVDVAVVDLASEKDGSKWIFPEADAYGISITTPQLSLAKKVAAKIKQLNNAPVIAGGPHPTVLPEETLQNGGFDSVVVGEGERAIVKAVMDVERGRLKRIYVGQPIENLDEIPFPARNLLPIDSVRTFEIMKDKYKEGGTTCIIGSRGCPFNCAFCPNVMSKVRFRSVRNIVTEIKQIIDQYGIYQFKFQDDCFTLNKRRLLALCQELKELDICFRIITRVDLISKELAEKLYEAGGRDASFGTESGSNKVLKMVNKGVTVEDSERAYRITKAAGWTNICNIIFGLPGEDEKTCQETKDFLIRNRQYIDVVNLGVLVPYPGTPIWNDPDRFNVEILTRNFDEYWFVGHSKSDKIFVRNRDVPLETMKKLKVDMYRFVAELGYAKQEWSKES